MSGKEHLVDHSSGDRVSRAIRAARRAADHGQGWTLQQVADATKRVAEEHPDLYEPMSRSMLSLIEGEGAGYFKRPVNAGKLRALIAVLFGRDHAEFERQTGVKLTVQLEEETPALPPLLAQARDASADAKLAVYTEGQARVDRADMQTQLGTSDYAVPEVPGCDFLFRVATTRMAPVAFPGQILGAAFADRALPGRVMVLRRGAEGLQLAWSLEQGRFLQQAPHSEPFSLEGTDTVIGEITHVRPFIPL